MNVEEHFINYKNITLIILEIIKSEEYEKLDKMFCQRQLILEKIKTANYSKGELNKYYLEYGLEKLNELLESEMKVKREYLLEKMKQNKKRQVGMAGYNNISAKAVFLSKKI